ncbi:MAG: hypothetical protein IKZ87_06080 [Actinomycetaceae bacterium]|nr:hypothetical protein [Actinomycetaceae bacterium]
MHAQDVYTVIFSQVADRYGDGEYAFTGTMHLVGITDTREGAEVLIQEDVEVSSGELRDHEDFGKMTLFEEGQYPIGYYSIIPVEMNRRENIPLHEVMVIC